MQAIGIQVIAYYIITGDAYGIGAPGGQGIVKCRVGAIVIKKTMPDSIGITIIADDIAAGYACGDSSCHYCQRII